MRKSRILATWLAFTLSVTWAFPSFGLRQETVEGSGLEELIARFLYAPRPAAPSFPPPGERQRAGLEEWEEWFEPDPEPLALKNSQVFLPLRGPAQTAHEDPHAIFTLDDLLVTVKAVSFLNTRGVTPFLLVYPKDEGRLDQLKVRAEGLDLNFETLWVDEENRLYTSPLKKQEFQAGTRGFWVPILVEPFSRQTGFRVPASDLKSVSRYTASSRRPLVIGIHGFSDVSKIMVVPDRAGRITDAQTIDLYPEWRWEGAFSPKDRQVLSGFLYDPHLIRFAGKVREEDRDTRWRNAQQLFPERTKALLAQLPPQAFRIFFEAHTQMHDPGLLNRLIPLVNEALEHRPEEERQVVLLTSYSTANHPRLRAWHLEQGHQVIDLTGQFPPSLPATFPAPVTVVNLSPLSLVAQRHLMVASDLEVLSYEHTVADALFLSYRMSRLTYTDPLSTPLILYGGINPRRLATLANPFFVIGPEAVGPLAEVYPGDRRADAVQTLKDLFAFQELQFGTPEQAERDRLVTLIREGNPRLRYTSTLSRVILANGMENVSQERAVVREADPSLVNGLNVVCRILQRYDQGKDALSILTMPGTFGASSKFRDPGAAHRKEFVPPTPVAQDPAWQIFVEGQRRELTKAEWILNRYLWGVSLSEYQAIQTALDRRMRRYSQTLYQGLPSPKELRQRIQGQVLTPVAPGGGSFTGFPVPPDGEVVLKIRYLHTDPFGGLGYRYEQQDRYFHIRNTIRAAVRLSVLGAPGQVWVTRELVDQFPELQRYAAMRLIRIMERPLEATLTMTRRGLDTLETRVVHLDTIYLQPRVTPLDSHLSALIRWGRLQEAKRWIDRYFPFVHWLWRRAIAVGDLGLDAIDVSQDSLRVFDMGATAPLLGANLPLELSARLPDVTELDYPREIPDELSFVVNTLIPNELRESPELVSYFLQRAKTEMSLSKFMQTWATGRSRLERELLKVILKGMPEVAEAERILVEPSPTLEKAGLEESVKARLEAAYKLRQLVPRGVAGPARVEVDLQLHTMHSDGFDTPTALVYQAYRMGLKAISITDHYSLAGIPEALQAGAIFGVEVIPGVELDTRLEGVDILGYFPQVADLAQFQERVNTPGLDRIREIQQAQMERAKALFVRINELLPDSMKLTFQDLLPFVRGGPIYPGNIYSAFREKNGQPLQDYLKSQRLPWVGKEVPLKTEHDLSPVGVIRYLRSIGAVPVLAHPAEAMARQGWDLGRLASEVEAWSEAGLMGVEINSSYNTPDQMQGLTGLLERHNHRFPNRSLIGTVGSDSHGTFSPNQFLGLGKVDEANPKGNLMPVKGTYVVEALRFSTSQPLREVVDLSKVVHSEIPPPRSQGLLKAKVVLISLDAGESPSWKESGGQLPVPITPVAGLPAGWRTKQAAEEMGWPVICVVDRQTQTQVMEAFNRHSKRGLTYVISEDPTGGTGYAVYLTASVLANSNALAMVTFGDLPRIGRTELEQVQKVFEKGQRDTRGVDLVVATAIFPDPKGKGRLVRARDSGEILGILEEREIRRGVTLGDYAVPELLASPEGYVGVIAMPAKRLFAHLGGIRNNNPERRFDLTDLVRRVLDQGGRAEAVRIDPAKAYELRRVEDVAKMEAAMAPDSAAGLEEMIPQLTPDALNTWKDQLHGAPPALRELYGWLSELPNQDPAELGRLMETVSQTYSVFGDFMQSLHEKLPSERLAHRDQLGKPDDTWVWEITWRTEEEFARLVQERFPQMTFLGEEVGVVPAQPGPFRVFTRFIDGKRAYMKPTERSGSDHYLSLLTLTYKEHPVLSIAVAPQYRYRPTAKTPKPPDSGLWLVAGLGIDGVLVNGKPTQRANQEDRFLTGVIGGIGVLEETKHLMGRSIRVFQDQKAKGLVVYGDGMALYEIPLSLLYPDLPGIYLAGEQPIREILPPWHFIKALGGRVTSLDGLDFKLTEQMVSSKEQRDYKVPLRLYSAYPTAHQQFLTAYQRTEQREATQFVGWRQSESAKRFLLPDPKMVGDPIPLRELVEFKVERILAAYRGLDWRGKYAEGFSGPDEAMLDPITKRFFVDLVADRLKRRIAELKAKDPTIPEIQVVRFREDWFVYSREERTQWLTIPYHPKALDHKEWIRWEKLYAALDEVWRSTGQVVLTGLYDTADGLDNHVQVLPVGENAILLMDGTYLLDRNRYNNHFSWSRENPRFLEVHTVFGITAGESFDRELAVTGRDPVDLERYFEAYLTRWWGLVEQWKPQDRAELIIDMSSYNFPRLLSYGPSQIVSTGLEEHPIGRRRVQAKGDKAIVDWRPTHPSATVRGIVRELGNAGITWEQYLRVKDLFAAQEVIEEGVFTGMPTGIQALAGSPDRTQLIARGRSQEVLSQFGVVIMAAGEGSRLLLKLIELGLLPSNALDIYTKPTLPVMPLTGKSPLQIQLEVLAAISGELGVKIPVTVVVNEETQDLVRRLLGDNQNFGFGDRLKVVVQGISPTLTGQGRILLRDDGKPALNPDGTGGVLRALKKDGIFNWFRELLGPAGRFFLINGDMLLTPDFIYLVAGASRTHPVVGVAYPYPPDKPDRGVFITVRRDGTERIEIVEPNYRSSIVGLPERLEEMARAEPKEPVYGNSGMYAFALEGMEEKVEALPLRARRAREVVQASQVDPTTGKTVAIQGNKAEYYATDMVGQYQPQEIGLLVVEREPLEAMKDPAGWEFVKRTAIAQGRAQAEALGISLHPEAVVEFHPSFRGSVGQGVQVQDPAGVYFDRAWIFIKQGDTLRLYKEGPDLPDGARITAGPSTELGAGLEEEFLPHFQMDPGLLDLDRTKVFLPLRGPGQMARDDPQAVFTRDDHLVTAKVIRALNDRGMEPLLLVYPEDEPVLKEFEHLAEGMDLRHTTLRADPVQKRLLLWDTGQEFQEGKQGEWASVFVEPFSLMSGSRVPRFDLELVAQYTTSNRSPLLLGVHGLTDFRIATLPRSPKAEAIDLYHEWRWSGFFSSRDRQALTGFLYDSPCLRWAEEFTQLDRPSRWQKTQEALAQHNLHLPDVPEGSLRVFFEVHERVEIEYVQQDLSQLVSFIHQVLQKRPESERTGVLFTHYGPTHTALWDWHQAQGHQAIDLSGQFPPSGASPTSPLIVINLPSLPLLLERRLIAGMDVAAVSYEHSLVDLLYLSFRAPSEAPLIFYLGVHEGLLAPLTNPLYVIGPTAIGPFALDRNGNRRPDAVETYRDIVAFHELRLGRAQPAESDRLIALVQNSRDRRRYMEELGRIVISNGMQDSGQGGAVVRYGDPSLVNGLNVITRMLERYDQGNNALGILESRGTWGASQMFRIFDAKVTVEENPEWRGFVERLKSRFTEAERILALYLRGDSLDKHEAVRDVLDGRMRPYLAGTRQGMPSIETLQARLKDKVLTRIGPGGGTFTAYPVPPGMEIVLKFRYVHAEPFGGRMLGYPFERENRYWHIPNTMRASPRLGRFGVLEQIWVARDLLNRYHELKRYADMGLVGLMEDPFEVSVRATRRGSPEEETRKSRLNTVGFQKRIVPLLDHIRELLKQDRFNEAKGWIDRYFGLLQALWHHGIFVADLTLSGVAVEGNELRVFDTGGTLPPAVDVRLPDISQDNFPRELPDSLAHIREAVENELRKENNMDLLAYFQQGAQTGLGLAKFMELWGGSRLPLEQELVGVIEEYLKHRIVPTPPLSTTGLEERWDQDPEVQGILSLYPSHPHVYGQTVKETAADHVRRVVRLVELLAKEWKIPEEDHRPLKLAVALHDYGKLHEASVEAYLGLIALAEERLRGASGKPVPLRPREVAQHFGLHYATRDQIVPRVMQVLLPEVPQGQWEEALRKELETRGVDLSGIPPGVDIAKELLRSEIPTLGVISTLNIPDPMRRLVEAIVRDSVWGGLLSDPIYRSTLPEEVAQKAEDLGEILALADSMEASTNLARGETFYIGIPRDLSNVIRHLDRKVKLASAERQPLIREKAKTLLGLLSPGHPRHKDLIEVLEESRHIGLAGQAWTPRDRQLMEKVRAGAPYDDLVAAASQVESGLEGISVEVLSRFEGNDLERLIRLQQQFDHFADHLTVSRREGTFRDLVGGPSMRSFLVVARDPNSWNEIVGYAMVRSHPRDPDFGESVLELEEIYVGDPSRGKGAASRMVEAVFDQILRTPELSNVTQLFFVDDHYLRENHVILKVARARGYLLAHTDESWPRPRYWIQLPPRPAEPTAGLEGPTAGLEEVRVLAPQGWVGSKGMTIGKIVPIVDKNNALVGRILQPDLERVRLVSQWNPEIENPDFPKWQQPPPALDMAVVRELHQTGLSLDAWRQRMEQPPTELAGAHFAFVSNSLQSNFNHPWGFLVVDGQVIRQKYAQEGYPLEETLWAFVLEPGPPRVAALHFEANRLAGNVAHAIAGPPLILQGQDLSGQIRSNVMPDGSQQSLKPGEITWDPATTEAAFSAIGMRQGQVALVAVTQNMKVRDFTHLLLRAGFTEATLLGGSGDVQQWVAQDAQPLMAESRADSLRPGIGRPLNATLAGYELPTAGLEERGIRFEGIEESVGLHGLVFEGEATPLARVFAEAAALGHRIAFAVIGPESERLRLMSDLEQGAARILSLRFVATDEIGIEAARAQAERLLIEQIPFEDRSLLVVTWVRDLWENLIDQILGLLRLMNLRFAGVEEQEKALELVTSA